MNFLKGVKILEKVNSKVNGKIRVVKSLGFGKYIQVEGLTQSGGIVETMWRQTLKKVSKSLATNHQTLVLGLGGGSAAVVVQKYWPKAKITGVDIDPVIVELGKKYLGLDKIQVQIKVQDAYQYTKYNIQNTKFDLIIVDTYIGYEYPTKLESDLFLKLILRHLSENGIAVFNRLYFDKQRPAAMKFGNKLEKVFTRVEYFYPQANLMFLCRA